MASLVGQLLKNIYKGLIITSDNDIITSTPKNLTDGLGNASALSLSTTSIVVSGSLILSGSMSGDITNATFDVTTYDTFEIDLSPSTAYYYDSGSSLGIGIENLYI
jgi:hypothetical protein